MEINMKENILKRRKFIKLSTFSGFAALIAGAIPFGIGKKALLPKEEKRPLIVKAHPDAIKRNNKG